MERAGTPANEKGRLKELYKLNILDTIPERQFDDITKIASAICQTPVSLITLIDKNRQWFKSKKGLNASETPRELAFCAHAILKPREILIVPDAREDKRFHDNPLVKEYPNVIFYAGAPLYTDDGNALGTLCVIDHQPRKLNKEQIEALSSLAHQVVYMFEARKRNEMLNQATRELQNTNELLSQFAYTASHDLKAPLKNIVQIASLMQIQFGLQIGQQGNELIGMLNERVTKMENLVSGILSYSKSSSLLNQDKETFDLNTLIKEIISFNEIPPDFKIKYDNHFPEIKAHKVALQQILLNLINNAIKYNDKKDGVIEVKFEERKYYYVFSVSDNGQGIKEKDQQTIFEPFKTLGIKDRNNDFGTGMGLSLVKKLVELMGGKIRMNSELGKGTTFNISIKK